MTSEQIQDLRFLIRMHRNGTMLSREGLKQLVDLAEKSLAYLQSNQHPPETRP